jgi:glycosyltransferase involved in cell wall biosynthesis
MARRSHKSIGVRLDELARDYTGRFRPVRLKSRDVRCEEYGHHDWTVCLGSYGVFGLDALESLAHGVPVASFNQTPYTEIVQHNYSGITTVCDDLEEIRGATHGDSGPRSCLELLQRLCEEPERLEILRSREWSYLKNRYQAFRLGWRRLLDC